MKSPLKWVGGKRSVIEQLEMLIPDYSGRYIEPMVGGGALYFHLRPERAILSDLNKHLVNTYQSVRDYVDKVLAVLNRLSSLHALDPEATYYDVRTEFNKHTSVRYEQAACFLYLNKTTYNGLWRVNKSGGFNSPFGKHLHFTPDAENLVAVSKQLKSAELWSGYYDEILELRAERGDFVYLDPPYVGTYTGYTSDQFGEDAHRRQAEVFETLVKKGCRVLLSNSNHPFVRGLYREYPQIRIWSKRAVAADPEKRGTVAELAIIGGYDPPDGADVVPPSQL